MRAQTAWVLSTETLPWRRDPARPLSRSQRARVASTYAAAVPVTITELEIHVAAETLAASDDARAEISRFDAELSSMLPGTELAPLPTVLLRTESTSSSQIEDVTAGARAVAMAELDLVRSGSNARLVAANVEAMSTAIRLADTVDPDAILGIHAALMHEQEHAAPGRFRTEQVWIGGSGASPHGATFVPPHHSRVPAAIDDLCAFVARTDTPLLAQCAIAHAQFETIHPFTDGNGRVGRALVHAMLHAGRATTRATVPVSAGLLTDTESYFAALTAYRDGNVDPIIDRFTEATFAAIANGRQLAVKLVSIHDEWTTRITARRTASIWRALPLLLSQPVVTSSLLQSALGLSQPATDQVIARLRDAGILTKTVGRQRYVAWAALEVTAALDEFAERARRMR